MLLKDLTKNLSPTQTRALKKLIEQNDWTSSYQLGESLATLNALQKRDLIKSKHELGSMFSPQVNIQWKAKYKYPESKEGG